MNVSSDHPGVQLQFSPSLPYENSSVDSFQQENTELERLLLLTIQEPTTIALTVMYVLSFVVGFIGNIMSIKVLTSRRSKRLPGVSATRSLLINLAVCDLMVVCVCMPITLGHKIYTVWVYGDFLCRAVPFTQAVSVSASVLSLTVISVNRYYSVHSPLNARSFFTRRKIFWTIVVVWVFSSGICSPLVFMNQRDEFRPIEDLPFVFPICREIWPQARMKQVYNVLLFVALYCLPVTFNLTISCLTGRKLWCASHHFAEFDPRGQAAHSSRLKVRKKIAKMVVALVLLFAVSWLPLYVADIWIDHEVHPPPWILQLRPFAEWLGLTNSSLNPICYCFIGDLYRSAKVIRSKYRQRFLSFFRSSSSNALPTLLSLKRPRSTQHKETMCSVLEDRFSDWYSNTSICETALGSSQQVSLKSTLRQPGDSGDSRDVSDHTGF
ncbi:gastrin/cholecystokinin type B receptor [Megalops cyprinoides]|uniref:gastrin/cholecystokinin type B receptor n=1 Tax=Megalops cyprinoides TaxID=118141 RepID=UPI001864964C|nr:gastrin/cholecystokinin type B receptor [Megalops cyprinoides]